MSNAVREILYKTLKELSEELFEEFNWWLKDIDYDGKPAVSGYQLEKANRQEVVERMIQNYGEDVALKVCTVVLKKCNLYALAVKLEETIQKDVVPQQVRDSSDYRNYIKRKFSRIKDPNFCPGDDVHLNQRYSKVIMIEKYQPERERKHEIMASGREHAELMNTRDSSSTSIETLFEPDEYGLIPQVVVLQGAAGIGKTMTARKIMFDWASERLYQDMFEYVFYIHCREMNLHENSEESSIEKMISKLWPQSYRVKNTIGKILRNPEKLLFIIDGFDELRFSLDKPNDCLYTDPSEEALMSVILSSLFLKKVLPESYLLITTRPTALEKLHRCLELPRCFKMLGFSMKEREEYFHNFFENKDQATQALKIVKQNDALFTMCVIPLVSWIICTVMKQEMEGDEDLQQKPYTLTAVYMLYLSSLLKFHHKESNQDIQRNVKGLCSLAAEGIWKQQILFTKEELKKHNLDQEDSLPLFLNENIFKRDIGCIQMYSFIHLSFQEFFAALFYVLAEEEEQHFENQKKNLQTLLESSLSSRLDLAVTVRFLFGSLNEEKRMAELKKEFGWKNSPKIKEFLLDCVKTISKKLKSNSPLWKEVFNYFYEIQDDKFLKNSLEDVILLKFLCKSVWDLIILAYCIQHCNSLKVLEVDRPDFSFLTLPMTRFDQFENHEEQLVERYVELFFKALISLGNLRKLSIFIWFLTESCFSHLAEFLRKNQKLKELYLPRVDIDDKSMKLLCEELKHPDCQLEILQLSGEALTESCSRHLADLLRKTQRLLELNLSASSLVCGQSEEPFKLLCEGLKDPDCKLEIFRFSGQTLTLSCYKQLAEVLQENQRLRQLDLTQYHPNGEDIQLLSEGLKHADCKLETLSLSVGRVLREFPCKYLAEVLKENQSLRKLCLTTSVISDEGMELLFEALRDPCCKLEKLWLSVEMFTTSFCQHLVDVLRENQALKELALGTLQIRDEYMEQLCEILKHPNCKLEIFRISDKYFRESRCRYLAEVLKENQTLKTLDLHQCPIDGRGMELLCEGLKHPNCKLEKLWIPEVSLTESCCRHLAQVFKENQSLRELNLFHCNVGDKEKELLREGLKHPACKLEKILVNEKCVVLNHRKEASTGITDMMFSFIRKVFRMSK